LCFGELLTAFHQLKSIKNKNLKWPLQLWDFTPCSTFVHANWLIICTLLSNWFFCKHAYIFITMSTGLRVQQEVPLDLSSHPSIFQCLDRRYVGKVDRTTSRWNFYESNGVVADSNWRKLSLGSFCFEKRKFWKAIIILPLEDCPRSWFPLSPFWSTEGDHQHDYDTAQGSLDPFRTLDFDPSLKRN
jgi:hypothetical protein